MGKATWQVSRRIVLGALDGELVASIPPNAVVIRPLAPRARFSLRLHPSLLSTLKEAAGFMLDLPINRGAASAQGRAMRLGPDEWLWVGLESATAQIALDAEAALAGVHHSFVDISHRHAALSVAGARAADVLNSGCPLDLAPSRFPAGCVTRTLLGKAEVILAKIDDTPTFEIECGRSFAAYVGDFLLEAAREFRAQD